MSDAAALRAGADDRVSLSGLTAREPLYHSFERVDVMLSRERGDHIDGSPADPAADESLKRESSTLHSLNLAELGHGEFCRVIDIAGEDAVAARLMEMGVVPGTELVVMGSAIGGDPIEVRVRNYRLTLRRSEAGRVLVQRTSGGVHGH